MTSSKDDIFPVVTRGFARYRIVLNHTSTVLFFARTVATGYRQPNELILKCQATDSGGAQVAHPPARWQKSISYAIVSGDTFRITVSGGRKNVEVRKTFWVGVATQKDFISTG